jgi:glucosyltransferase
MEDKISVIVATYNQEDTIARTLDSVLMQQCHVPIEIILGEDCSTDGTLAVCQRYADEHPDVIRLIANKQNKGLVDNYFDCMLAAQGKYIADCAGDDFWTDPLKLE